MEEDLKKIEELNNLLTGEAKEIYSQSLENLLTRYKQLEKENKELKEWYEMQKQEITERNIKVRQVFAKIKKIKETDIINLHETNILDEIEKEWDLKLKQS